MMAVSPSRRCHHDACAKCEVQQTDVMSTTHHNGWSKTGVALDNVSTTTGKMTSVVTSSVVSRVYRTCRSSPLALMMASILFSAVPYVVFLVVYGANGLLGVLPTSKSGQAPCTPLYNVSAWESTVLPFSVNRAIASWRRTPLDFLSAVPYLAHYVLPVVYPLALVVVAGRPDCARRFYRLVGWTMWVHYVIWYALPTAPPWFYDANDAAAAAAGSGVAVAASVSAAAHATGPAPELRGQLIVPEHREGAAFARIDSLTGVGFFYGLFAGNPVPFAAFPSGHVAWPTCIVLTVPATTGRGQWPFICYVLLVAWATMYSSHHYLFDVLAAVLVVLLVDRVIERLQSSTTVLRLGLAAVPSRLRTKWSWSNGVGPKNGFVDV